MGLKPRRENCSLNTSNLKEEINCFKRTSLNGLCPNTDLFPFIESKAIEEEKRSTYWCMLTVLNSLFFFFFFSLLLLLTSYFSFFFFFLLFLLNAYFWVMVFPKNSYYCDFSQPSLVHNKKSFI